MNANCRWSHGSAQKRLREGTRNERHAEDRCIDQTAADSRSSFGNLHVKSENDRV